MSFESAGYDRKSPVLVGALGRAWIAFSTDDERRRILRSLGVRQGPTLKAALEGIRRDGYAFTRPPRPMRMHGMAVPILDKDRVAGCISMCFPRSAMSETEAGTRYGELLAKMTAAIAADLATRRDTGL